MLICVVNACHHSFLRVSNLSRSRSYKRLVQESMIHILWEYVLLILKTGLISATLHERHGASIHRQPDCLFNRLFGLTSTSKPASLALCEGNPPVTDGFPSQRPNNAENFSMAGCHHILRIPIYRKNVFFWTWVLGCHKNRSMPEKQNYHGSRVLCDATCHIPCHMSL